MSVRDERIEIITILYARRNYFIWDFSFRIFYYSRYLTFQYGFLIGMKIYCVRLKRARVYANNISYF